MPGEDRMIWVDVETFGLDPHHDPIIEVGFTITDLDLNTIDDFQEIIWDSPTYDRRYSHMVGRKEEEFVFNMHQKSGLFREAQMRGLPISAVEERMNTFLEGHGIKNSEEPLCGSSVKFDWDMLQAQFPSVHSRFHYRVIDISTVKELCRRYAPDIYEKNTFESRKIHRVLPDLEDTVNEFRFYRDNFIWDTRDAS